MRNTAVQEHVGDDLVRFEKDRMDVMKGKHFFDVKPGAPGKGDLCQEHQHIDDYQVFYNGWKDLRPRESEIGHLLFSF